MHLQENIIESNVTKVVMCVALIPINKGVSDFEEITGFLVENNILVPVKFIFETKVWYYSSRGFRK